MFSFTEPMEKDFASLARRLPGAKTTKFALDLSTSHGATLGAGYDVVLVRMRQEGQSGSASSSVTSTEELGHWLHCYWSVRLSLHYFPEETVRSGIASRQGALPQDLRVWLRRPTTQRDINVHCRERSLMDRGYATSCMAATTLRKIGGNIRGANAMRMPHARNPL
ncbi:hypothetical protein MTO96_041447 [Rhipicephalus appendiculatus]